MILNGWKEIANYMGRGVRTVQRWEKLGLPLHRPNNRLRSAVVTTSEELDKWLAECVNGRTTISLEAGSVPEPPATMQADVAKANRLLVELEHFLDGSRRMREQLSITRSRTQLLRTRSQACHSARAALQKTAKSVRWVA